MIKRYFSTLIERRPLAPLRLRRLGEAGVTAVEFALIAPVLFMLFMGIVEYGLAEAANMLLKHATYTAAREGRTGFSSENSTREETVRAIVRKEASLLMDADKLSIDSRRYTDFATMASPEPFIDANGNGIRDNGENYTDLNGNGQYDGAVAGIGGATQVVVYTVSYPWKFFTPLIGNLAGHDGVLTLTAKAVVQNEPYNTGSSGG
ncbi:TadE/TadG family type IV pilus assembly protein [Consotaella salsifontis]|uniref:TadE-like protein n=1 Tax=Consotaella salsifontis TaxID=1365950 RepID=A0A1T4T785_9HYPH|nr:TadE family protein [Consotaella salsifontis]SKA36365.1 TadE-like protein [Consotaella salsifontis]